MAIQRWDPQRDLVQLQTGVNRMFEEVLGRSSTPQSQAARRPGDWQPPVDLAEESGQFVISVDLPGVAPSDVEVRIEENLLSLSGERRGERGVQLRMERPMGRFSVEVALPSSIDRQQVQAQHRNGVLQIVLPKRKTEQPSRVNVTDG
jgi:HSP20 family protein